MTTSAAGQNRAIPAIATDILQDSVDLRDLIYRPALSRLMPRADAVFMDVDGTNKGIVVRDQKNTDACTGFALASLIDIQQYMEHSPGESDEKSTRAEPVSAEMLFEMGALHSAEIVSTRSDNDQPSDRPQKSHSIRSAIKGFYHNGVCPDGKWPSNWRTDVNSKKMVECMKSARKLSLGAYYRLQHHLSDYHCALNEVGCLLVSAHLHKGWTFEEVARNGEIRMYDDFTEQYGAHAFVIVGYDEKGFLVLNSWGEEWGGRHKSGAPTPGIAHWSYKDWAESIMDAWVLRLAVSTPDAFEYTQGAQGSTWFAGASVNGSVNALAAGNNGVSLGTSLASVPRQHVIGHYVHFESAGYVESGSYPDSEISLKTTLQHIRRKLSISLAELSEKEAQSSDDDAGNQDPRNSASTINSTDTKISNSAISGSEQGDEKPESSISRVYLRVSGDTGSVEDAMHRIAMLRRCLRPQGIYPLTFVWTARIASAFAVGIKACMAEAVARMPDPSTDRDELIESLIRPIGHPLWNQLKQEANALVLPADKLKEPYKDQSYRQNRLPTAGPLTMTLKELNDTIVESESDQHDSFVAPVDLCFEGAGTLVFIALLKECNTQCLPLLRFVRRITLAFPVADHQNLLDCLRKLRLDSDSSKATRAGCDELMKRITILLPNENFLNLSSIGPYTRTWFHLANNSFESRPLQTHAHRSISLITDEQISEYRKVGIPEENLKKAGPKITRRGNSASILRTSVVSKPFLDSILGLAEASGETVPEAEVYAKDLKDNESAAAQAKSSGSATSKTVT